MQHANVRGPHRYWGNQEERIDGVQAMLVSGHRGRSHEHERAELQGTPAVVTDAFSLEPSTSALHCVGQIHLESVHTQEHLDDAATSIQGSAKRVGTSMVRCAGNVCQ